ncbi:MAG: glycosyltransferase family 39 protein [Anaerolineae bacterium]|nr:glycosyltransferase family 39 protein [Anaerolineae bacterium]
MSTFFRQHGGAAIIAGIFLALSTLYSLSTPVFEASDEVFHYPVIDHIRVTGELPVQHPGVETLWEQEGSQPPLYYLMSAALTAWIDTGDLLDVHRWNPHAKLGIPLDPDNKNMILHTGAEAFPWQGTVLAVHLIRFFSILLGTGSIILVYALAQTIRPDNRPLAWLSMGLVAFNPMFLFITASVNNDNLTVLLSAWIMLLLARILQDGLTTRRVITLAVVAGLATLTKISGLTLLPIIGLVLLFHAWRTREWRQMIAAGLAIAIACLAISGWWYFRNITLYGELLGLNTHVAVAGGREISLWDLRHEWYGFWVSYWALFGAVNILADPGVYTFYTGLSVIAVAGLIWWVAGTVRTKSWTALVLPGLLAIQAVVVFIGVINWTLRTYASQGRLVFPAIGALSILTALGLLSLLPKRWQSWCAIVANASLLAIAAAIPFHAIAPTYAPPPIVTQVPEDAIPIGAHFDGLELIAIRTDLPTVEEGGRVPVTLYWRATEPIDRNYSVFIHALGRGYAGIGKIDTYPGGGKLPTTQMQPGDIIEDTYSIELEQDFDTPTIIRAQVGVGVWSPESFPSFEPTRADDSPFGSVIVEAGVAYPRGMGGCRGVFPDDADIQAELGGFARFRAQTVGDIYHAGESVPITLYWNRHADTTTDWTVFVHLVDDNNIMVAQADAPPLGNDYPTRLWRLSCQIADVHTLQLPADLPPGDYRILVGMYDAADPAYTRALATTLEGSPYSENAIPIGTITVEAP